MSLMKSENNSKLGQKKIDKTDIKDKMSTLKAGIAQW